MKISASIMRTIEELSEDEKVKVDAIIRAHIEACRANGLEPENLERIYIEAIEIVKLEAKNPPPEGVISEEEYKEAMLTSTHYSVYQPPKEGN
jgi:hypothetical protein